jgi:hypothetical protein
MLNMPSLVTFNILYIILGRLVATLSLQLHTKELLPLACVARVRLLDEPAGFEPDCQLLLLVALMQKVRSYFFARAAYKTTIRIYFPHGTIFYSACIIFSL